MAYQYTDTATREDIIDDLSFANSELKKTVDVQRDEILKLKNELVAMKKSMIEKDKIVHMEQLYAQNYMITNAGLYEELEDLKKTIKHLDIVSDKKDRRIRELEGDVVHLNNLCEIKDERSRRNGPGGVLLAWLLRR